MQNFIILSIWKTTIILVFKNIWGKGTGFKTANGVESINANTDANAFIKLTLSHRQVNKPKKNTKNHLDEMQKTFTFKSVISDSNNFSDK